MGSTVHRVTSDLERLRRHDLGRVHGHHIGFVGAQRGDEIHHLRHVVDAGQGHHALVVGAGIAGFVDHLRRDRQLLLSRAPALRAGRPAEPSSNCDANVGARGRETTRRGRNSVPSAAAVLCMLAMLTAVTSIRSFSTLIPEALISKAWP